MSKLTFRADDELVTRLESLDASKSQVIREALRRYLDDGAAFEPDPSEGTGLAEALDRAIDERVAARLDAADTGSPVNVTVEVPNGRTRTPRRYGGRNHAPDRPTRCHACGEPADVGHAYCPHCGAERGDSACTGCGRRLREDWEFCPDCGCRTPAPDVLDRP